MRPNRVRRALAALGGVATTHAIAIKAGARHECISAQLAGMADRGDVERAGRMIRMRRRWKFGRHAVEVTIWRLT